MSEIKATTNGKEWSDEEIMEYRLERAEKALEFLKTSLGPDGLRPLFDENTKLMTEDLLRARDESDEGDYAEAVVEMDVPGLKAEDYPKFFFAMGRGLIPQVNSHPEHYMMIPNPEGSELCESVGECPPYRMIIKHYLNPADIPFPVDPKADARVMAETFTLDGESTHVYALHQFYNTDEGFHSVSKIYFPAATDPAIVEGQQKHLVIEFGSWFQAMLDYAKAHDGKIEF